MLDDEAGLDDLNPEDSKLDFAVPAKPNWYRKDQTTEPVLPGIYVDHITTLSQKLSERSLKLCTDGKKISHRKGNKIGNIDLWGMNLHQL